MKDFPLPIRLVGAGSQPLDDDELQYLEMPRGINTFRMPLVPEQADATALAGARDIFVAFLKSMQRWDLATASEAPRLNLAAVPRPTLEITNQVLGEGEVAIQIGGVQRFRIQESSFTGVWRVCALDGQGRLAADWLEAGAIPRVALEIANDAASTRLPDVEIPPGAMNSPALLAEIASQLATREPGARAHVINLTLFPMTPEDHQVLQAALPVGPVAIMSRGFGNCRIGSTSARDVWRVQYFNNMNTLILDTLEVVDMPEVALAAKEDLEDSRTRIAELIEWMSESVAAEAAQ